MVRKRLVRGMKQMLGAPALAPISSWHAGQGTCLMYHRIIPDAALSEKLPGNSLLCVTESQFEEQMAYVARHRVCLDLPNATEAVAQGRLAKGSVVVTFDDGYRDNFTLGLPIMEKYGIPATIYVTSGFIDRQHPLWWDELELMVQGGHEVCHRRGRDLQRFPAETAADKATTYEALTSLFKATDEQQRLIRVIARSSEHKLGRSLDAMLTWDEVRELDRHPLITIGAHTQSHPSLAHLPPDMVYAEMFMGRATLERQLGHPVVHFAYPYGGPINAKQREFQIARAVGFRSAVTTRVGHWQHDHRWHMHALPRVAVDCGDSIGMFRWKLSGWQSMLQRPTQLLVTA